MSAQQAASTQASSAQADRRLTTILDLPSEVLLLILLDVYYAAKAEEHYWDESHIIVGNEDAYLKHPAPEYLASVHPSWRIAMSNASVFWMHLVVWTGANPTPLSRVRECLAWSHDRPIHIYIMRRQGSPSTDCEEGANVRHILDLILPHMSRWRSLEMKTLYASSLPVPRVDLVDSAPLLKELDLGHVVDDLCAETSAPLVGDFETPNLQTLLMGGRAFRDAYVRPFPQLKPPPIIWQVGITDYHPRNGPLALIDLLTCLLDLPRLKALSLNNLQLDCTADVAPLPEELTQQWGFTLEYYYFADMSGATIAELFRLLSDPSTDMLTVRHCTSPVPPGAHLPVADVITIEDVNDPTVLSSLLEALPGARSEMQLLACDGLNDDTLLRLAAPVTREPEQADDVWPFMYTSSLEIKNCPRFHSSFLRALIEARFDAHEEVDFADPWNPEFTVASIRSLSVSECCELQPLDKEWLDENVEYVVWDDWKGGVALTRNVNHDEDEEQ